MSRGISNAQVRVLATLQHHRAVLRARHELRLGGRRDPPPPGLPEPERRRGRKPAKAETSRPVKVRASGEPWRGPSPTRRQVQRLAELGHRADGPLR